MKSITKHLDAIASHLESLGMVKEAHDLDVVSNTIEKQANVQAVMQRAKALLSKIPSAKLMDPAQAKAVLQDAQQKDPQGTKSLLNEVMQTLQGSVGSQPMAGQEAGEKEASWGSLIKGLTNPRVLIAVLSLLASTGSALGATPSDTAKADTAQVQTTEKSNEQKLLDMAKGSNEILDRFIKENYGKRVDSGDLTNVENGITFRYGVGIDVNKDKGKAELSSYRRAHLKAAKGPYGGVALVHKVSFDLGNGLYGSVSVAKFSDPVTRQPTKFQERVEEGRQERKDFQQFKKEVETPRHQHTSPLRTIPEVRVAEEHAEGKNSSRGRLSVNTKFSSILDSIADSLEAQGLLKGAHDIDVVSNTIEHPIMKHHFFNQEDLKRKGQEAVNKFYQEYVDSSEGKAAYDKALKVHPKYNSDKAESEAATKEILVSVDKWLQDKGKSEGEVNLLKSLLKDKILAGITC